MATTLYSPEFRAISYLNKQMVPQLVYHMNARQYFEKVTPIPADKDMMIFDRIVNMGEAIVSYNLAGKQAETDEIQTTADSINLLYISRRWNIPYTRWQAFETEGIDLPVENMKSALTVIGVKETQLLTNGYTPDGSTTRINGLYGGAGNSYDTSKDFGTSGNAKDAVSGALDMIYASKVDGVNFNLILNSAQYRQLSTSMMSYTNVQEIDLVTKLLNENDGPSVGKIYKSPYITAGTGLLSPADPDGEFIELLVGQPITNDVGRDSKEPMTSPMYGKTFEKIAAHLIHPEAVCKLTAI